MLFGSRCLLLVGLMRHHGVNGIAVVVSQLVWHEVYVCLNFLCISSAWICAL